MFYNGTVMFKCYGMILMFQYEKIVDGILISLHFNVRNKKPKTPKKPTKT